MSNSIGALEIDNEIKVEWHLVDFFSLNAVNSRYCSPQFSFFGEPYCLVVRPNGENTNNPGWIALYLFKEPVSSPASVCCSFGLKTTSGDTYRNYFSNYVFKKPGGMGYNKYMKRQELVEKRLTLVPSGVLTIIFSIRNNKQFTVFRTEELIRDVTSLLKDEIDTDVVFRVEQEEIRVHRSVLRVRSPVLAVMFAHEMSEKTTGIVSIQDCRADVFRTFVDYLYTGKVGELTADKVFPLFTVADKYQVKELADDCIHYMANTLTEDTFFEAVEVASDHQNRFLMKAAARLLSDKIAAIIRTEKWEKLMDANPRLANKLLQKAFDIEDNRRN